MHILEQCWCFENILLIISLVTSYIVNITILFCFFMLHSRVGVYIILCSNMVI